MANAPSTLRVKGSQPRFGMAGSVALVANHLIDFATDGTVIVCAAGRKPAGTVQENFAASAAFPITYYHGGTQRVLTSGTVAIGDIVKATTGGLAIADTTSGSTALSVNSFGICRTTPDADAYADIYFF